MACTAVARYRRAPDVRSSASSLIHAVRVVIEVVYTASRIQQVMWHADEAMKGCGALSGCLMVRGSFDGEWLERRVERLTRRHRALRTAFRMRAGIVEGVVSDDVLPSFEAHDASTWSEEQLSERITAYLSRPFDLGVAPLCGLALFVRS